MQTFTAPLNTTYKIECWGAQGGDYNIAFGGRGAYVSGKIILNAGNDYFIYVGSKGHYTTMTENLEQEFNGGGAASGQDNAVNVRYWSSGGGATDIRLIGGIWDNFNSLKSRIIVAAGGGGIFHEDVINEYGGYGGALIGGNAVINLEYYEGFGTGGTGGTQLSGGYDYEPTNKHMDIGYYSNGDFGIGGYRRDYYHNHLYCASGGGGGYYGGGGSAHVHAAGGGSSFISCYPGCDAISESSTKDNIIHTGQPNHYSGKIFTNPIMIAGNISMPSPTGGMETGHSGNGYCIITWQQLP